MPRGHAPAPGADGDKSRRLDAILTTFVDPTGVSTPCLVYPAARPDAELQRLASIGLMTSEIAHDFSNLMQIMIAGLHLMGRDGDETASPSTRSVVRGLEAAAERAAILSRRVLNHSRPDKTGDEPTHIDTVLAGIEDLIRWAAGPAVQVELACQPAAPAVQCDPRELENAVLNLVINARTAMPDGGRIEIACYGEDAAAPWDRGRGAGPATVALRIADTGHGMSEDWSRRIFEPFFTARPKGVGGGLGLAIVADFIRRAEGSARVESAPGAGTAITLRFPACGADPQAE
jgi:signal transduction histidine kinase